MGGLVDEGGYLVAWTGGKPRPDWSRLALPAQINSNPNQLRVVGSKFVTPYNNRRSGLDTKYKHGEDLDTLMNDLSKQLKNHGMDSIAYREDPHEPTSMAHCLKEHARFNLEQVRQSSTKLKVKWDAYDCANDECAISFFLDSIEINAHQGIEATERGGHFLGCCLHIPHAGKPLHRQEV
jgi:hypothetical protein